MPSIVCQGCTSMTLTRVWEICRILASRKLTATLVVALFMFNECGKVRSECLDLVAYLLQICNYAKLQELWFHL